MKHIPGILILAAGALCAQAPRHITSPKEQFGFNVGDDYRLVNYTQLEAYWKKLASESDRMKLTDIGMTAEGRHQWMAILSSPDNLKNLARYKEISQKLAAAEGISSDQARAMANEGKAVVWIDGGLHATETAGSQNIIQMVYEMLSRSDPETQRLLRDDILLVVPANPDGQELVANWYMREKDETKRSYNALPRLYNKYIGHDDNRDSLTSNMPETANMNRQLFAEWNPQLMYNHHQSGPAGEVIFIPPLRDPVNHNVDPLVTLGIQAVGTALHERLVALGKGGSGMRTQANYDGWWNGGMRNTCTFHNTIALLTEIIGNPTPMEIPLIPEKQLYISDLPLPVAPQPWHFHQTIEYLMETNRAMLDYASRHRDELLYNIWRMGTSSIERGSKDYWTVTPKRVEALRAAAGEAPGGGRGGRGAQAAAGGGDTPGGGGFGARGVSTALYEKVLHDPAVRDPRGYILPSDQPDFPTATRFVNALLKNGLTVMQATAAFQVAGKSYPAGSYVVKSAQAFRPMVRDMFEPQDHPRDDLYPGGPPIPPYDIAGWTLAMQMGVEYDRIRDGFDGPFVKLNGIQKPMPRTVTGPSNPAGYLISHRSNYSFTLVNRLLKANAEVYWLKGAAKAGDHDLGTGAIWTPASAAVTPILQKSAADLGVAVYAMAQPPSGEAYRIPRVRIGLYDQYGGLMPSGWTRWLFEQYEFPFEMVYPQTLDAGNLKSRFDVLVFPDGAMRAGAGGRGGGGGRGGRGGAPVDPQTVPEEYRGWIGRITEDKSVPQIRQFVESGGAVIAVGSSTSMAELLGVPVSNALAGLPRDQFYIPGSLMRARVDNTNPLAYGMPETVDVFFDNNPVFRLAADARAKGETPIAWFSGKETLDSGWALGQQLLDGATAVVEAKAGEGKVFVLGPEVTFRGEPDGTYKLLFNGLFYGAAKSATLR